MPETAAPHSRKPSVLIIGAGFGGIGAAIELQREGYRDITILEAAPDIGGTWFHNTYPGSACDVPSHMYSYSYAQRRDWTRLCSHQDEILAYIHQVVADFAVDRLVVTDRPVATCVWDADSSVWTATTTDGETYAAGVLIVATGQLNHPHFPELPGVDSFEGVAFHSARWNHDVPLAGKRVAVIGNGASAVQFVPEVAKFAAHTTVFQRTGNFYMARKNRPYPAVIRAAVKYVPGLQKARRAGIFQFLEHITRSVRNPRTYGQIMHLQSIAFMRWQLRGDPELRSKVWPDYTFGCKRVLFTSKYLPALRRPDVDLNTERIAEIVPNGVRTADGRVHEVDALIYATGFRTTEFMLPMEIIGAGGEHLRDTWAQGAHAHLGITVPGFPSMFLMYGPNTNTSGGSILVYLEAQARYIRTALDLMTRTGARAISVRPEVEAASDRAMQERFAGTAWLDCDSWYRTGSGRIVTNWPGYMHEYLSMTREIEPSEFVLATDSTAPTASSQP